MTTSWVTHPDAAPDEARVRFGDVLVGLELLDGAGLEHALAEQQRRGGNVRLGQVLIDLGLASAADVALGLATAHGLPLVALESTAVDHEVARTIPRALAEKKAVIAYGRRDRRLLVAVADPVDIVALDDVRAVTGITGLDVGVAPSSLIRAALEAVWAQNADSDVVRDYIDENADREVEDEHESPEDAATIRLVDRLISHADRVRASDVHIEPQRDAVRIRMRVDGVLREMLSLPRSGYSALCARLKIIAELDVIERRLPQDGRARVRVDGRRIDVRVSTLPSLHGEKVVLRLLPRPTELPRLGPLGLDDAQRQLLLDATAKPQGLILFTGPTGSGKTNSQYAAIGEGVESDRNVITLEDPVEIELPGTTQVPIDEKSGVSFARGLRAALRQDPDVILVGEIRDQETAQLAVRAAITGHLVLSTLHTLDAAAAVTRLVDMGVPAYLVTSSLSLVASQRLVRIPCPDCSVPDEPAAALLAELGVDDAAGSWVRATGCRRCNESGYLGRTAVMELLTVGPEVRDALLSGADEDAVRRIARAAGTVSLFQRGIAMARDGRTTLSEVIRAVPQDPAGSFSRTAADL